MKKALLFKMGDVAACLHVGGNDSTGEEMEWLMQEREAVQTMSLSM